MSKRQSIAPKASRMRAAIRTFLVSAFGIMSLSAVAICLLALRTYDIDTVSDLKALMMPALIFILPAGFMIGLIEARRDYRELNHSMKD